MDGYKCIFCTYTFMDMFVIYEYTISMTHKYTLYMSVYKLQLCRISLEFFCIGEMEDCFFLLVLIFLFLRISCALALEKTEEGKCMLRRDLETTMATSAENRVGIRDCARHQRCLIHSYWRTWTFILLAMESMKKNLMTEDLFYVTELITGTLGKK